MSHNDVMERKQLESQLEAAFHNLGFLNQEINARQKLIEKDNVAPGTLSNEDRRHIIYEEQALRMEIRTAKADIQHMMMQLNLIAGVSVSSSRPPKRAEKLLYYVLPRRERDAVIGDLEEDHAAYAHRFGRPAADRWYWWQAVRTISPLLRRALLRWSLLAGVAKAAGWLWSRFGS